jgi:ketosteroid isomerase-like protein
MSQQNATLAWQAAHAWGEGGAVAILPFLDSEIEWHPHGRSALDAYSGHAGVCEYLGWFDETVRECRVEPIRVIDLDDDRVISVIRVSSPDAIFGEEVNAEWAWLISMARGKCVKVRTFTDREQALGAAGVPE